MRLCLGMHAAAQPHWAVAEQVAEQVWRMRPPRESRIAQRKACQERGDGNHGRSAAARRGNRPFAARRVRAKVHVKSMIVSPASMHGGGSCTWGQRLQEEHRY